MRKQIAARSSQRSQFVHIVASACAFNDMKHEQGVGPPRKVYSKADAERKYDE